ncbi:MAG: tetratricopeptide repeat protein, partial [Thermoanaerobaculia bacterium]|nr:tetratricopeptide repeat protein [Thermoanaerobaculia bacterium]
MTKRAKGWIVSFLLAASLPPAGFGQIDFDTQTDVQALIQRLVLDRAATIAAVQRTADEREQRILAELDAKDRRLRAELGHRKAAQAELARVTADRQKLVDEIAARDRQFAAEIAEYRKQVASIASSPDPRKKAALVRYAEGDRRGAYTVLHEIQRAETKAVAAGWREIAALGSDLKDRGEATTAEVIPVYEEAQKLDPEHHWGWVELGRLYQEAGRLPDARAAAEHALRFAEDDRGRSVGLIEIGKVLVATGDLAGARERFEQSLEILERLARDNSASAEAQLDLSVSYNKLGDLLETAGDLAGARERFELGLDILERLVRDCPAINNAKRDLSVSYERLGSVLVAAGDLAGARERFEQSLEIFRGLARDNPASAKAQRDLG